MFSIYIYKKHLLYMEYGVLRSIILPTTCSSIFNRATRTYKSDEGLGGGVRTKQQARQKITPKRSSSFVCLFVCCCCCPNLVLLFLFFWVIIVPFPLYKSFSTRELVSISRESTLIKRNMSGIPLTTGAAATTTTTRGGGGGDGGTNSSSSSSDPYLVFRTELLQKLEVMDEQLAELERVISEQQVCVCQKKTHKHNKGCRPSRFCVCVFVCMYETKACERGGGVAM